MLSDKTNIRVVIMNNILPSDIPIHEKYDLKGSLYKRKASKTELAKKCPTYKDLDFLEEHKDGLVLDEKHYENVISSLKRDCLILQSFGIMDYSMLLGIHNLEKEHAANTAALEAYYEAKVGDPFPTTPAAAAAAAAAANQSSSLSSANHVASANMLNVASNAAAGYDADSAQQQQQQQASSSMSSNLLTSSPVGSAGNSPSNNNNNNNNNSNNKSHINNSTRSSKANNWDNSGAGVYNM